ncbi:MULTISPECIES: SPOR domain-containing protein [Flavobacterium]|uniref:SPOR domain-containing protein n=2 Tax=Flavobacterium TaxID=237 RepID=A0A940XBD9_9FLAO|nr:MULTISPECIES: SPOR domain-containing protein [Flavobacterium]MBP4136529.1 SPOR domain-containing protein [Flavobacterium geliluteum]MDX6183517.1 SPOR domain-containing protein [Flavobacterium sp. Fl-33]MDX6187081.1 SPOR domain-containing protein [Flavobacterium sp. Fl-77]UFH40187.1 SPOR domain-containing protein [Flavobacterium sp. F-70]
MRILTPSSRVFFTLTMFTLAYNINAQDQNLTVNQDPKFEQLLNDKRKINTSINTNETYKIQIFSGKSEEAKKTLADFKREFSDIDGTIIFNTPNYKVMVGNFKTRIEAERNLIEIKKRYKSVFLLKPSK